MMYYYWPTEGIKLKNGFCLTLVESMLISLPVRIHNIKQTMNIREYANLKILCRWFVCVAFEQAIFSSLYVCVSNDNHIFCANGNVMEILFKGQMLQWQNFRWFFFPSSSSFVSFSSLHLIKLRKCVDIERKWTEKGTQKMLAVNLNEIQVLFCTH